LCSAGRSQPGGLFIFALYRKTKMCGFWKIEKKWYTKASNRGQSIARKVYIGVYRACLTLKQLCKPGWKPETIDRGMNFDHDVHDWLGGYPYESISPGEVDNLMHELRFERKITYLKQARLGLLGSGCDEYCYVRVGFDTPSH
jgi:2-polyprenyl-6-hydroxyphenyl methylase/3-demethylubiquinone-9 3-methyltransferase